jgi:cysteine synthase
MHSAPGTRTQTSVLDAIGDTPVVQLSRVVEPESATVLVKIEYYSPTGSYKDRMAVAMIDGAERRGTLRSGMRVIEFTGGSTGPALALVCGVKGYPFIVVSHDAVAPEKLALMRALGAELHVVPSDNGMFTAGVIRRMREETERLANDGNTYFTDQFHNDDALDGYARIGTELLDQCPETLSAFVAAVGSGGMLMGVARSLRERGCRASIVAVEPAASPILTKGVSGGHRIDGVGPGFVPKHLENGGYDRALAIDESEARAMARRLAREEGIFAGTSSGLNVAAALRVARELGPGHTVATVAVDTGLKYLAGDLYTG